MNIKKVQKAHTICENAATLTAINGSANSGFDRLVVSYLQKAADKYDGLENFVDNYETSFKELCRRPLEIPTHGVANAYQEFFLDLVEG